jgi:undecaprenyl-phosphate alpha-N-acetylglucosaminyl 1-phosphatetransferase
MEIFGLPHSSSAVAVAVVALSLLVLIVLTPFARRLRLIDKPSDRKQHRDPTPAIGGLVIYIITLSSILLLDPDPKLAWMMAAVTVLVVTGAIDDAFGLSIKVRFTAQVLGACVMIVGGGLHLTSLGTGIGFLEPLPGWFGFLFTVFALVGLTNGFNMADGIDGLASGYMLIGLLLVVATTFYITGTIPQFEWFVALFSAVLVFFMVNTNLTPLRKVFLGDAGSMLLGFVMGWTLIYCSQEPISAIQPVAALWCVAIPVWDTVIVIARRFKNRRSPFEPDRNHLHYVLVDLGMKQEVALVVILSGSATVGAFGVILTYLTSPLLSLIAFGLFLVAFGYGMLHPAIEKKIAIKLGLITSH